MVLVKLEPKYILNSHWQALCVGVYHCELWLTLECNEDAEDALIVCDSAHSPMENIVLEASLKK